MEKLVFELQVSELMNIQFTVKDNEMYLLKITPCAAPFISKDTGVALAKMAALVMVGKSLVAHGVTREVIPPTTR